MSQKMLAHFAAETDTLRAQGLFKAERLIETPQNAAIRVGGQPLLNFCANNYLGLADNAELISAAQQALDDYGFGMASVRFICGTQTLHKQLEARVSAFLNTADTILYSSCFDANTGLFETLLDAEDAVISDALNHASIIDGVRLCKAKRLRYANNDMAELEQQLIEAKDARFRLIATDGVFSMDGVIANLPAICDLAEKYDALVMVDDSHAVGFVGPNGRGTPEHFGLQDRVHLVTGTFGKALGGASGGYTSGRRELIEWLRQRSRPYLFSNSLAPVIAATQIKVFDLLEADNSRIKAVQDNSVYFRAEMTKLGFTLLGADHAIIPVLLGDAVLAQQMAARMLDEGIYVVGFAYPVVPQGKARIRTQISSAHTKQQLDQAIKAFGKIGLELGVI